MFNTEALRNIAEIIDELHQLVEGVTERVSYIEECAIMGSPGGEDLVTLFAELAGRAGLQTIGLEEFLRGDHMVAWQKYCQALGNRFGSVPIAELDEDKQTEGHHTAGRGAVITFYHERGVTLIIPDLYLRAELSKDQATEFVAWLWARKDLRDVAERVDAWLRDQMSICTCSFSSSATDRGLCVDKIMWLPSCSLSPSVRNFLRCFR